MTTTMDLSIPVWIPDFVNFSNKELDRECLEKAYWAASEKSNDKSTTNGSVLRLKSDQDINMCCAESNYFPRGVKETPERLERPAKYSFVEHAERNAIFSAARDGYCTKDAILYCTWYACADCARAIVQAGISEVVGHLIMFQKTPSHWVDTILVGFTILNEGGVKCSIYTEKVFRTDKYPHNLKINNEIFVP